jgi:hypothetical protein
MVEVGQTQPNVVKDQVLDDGQITQDSFVPNLRYDKHHF